MKYTQVSSSAPGKLMLFGEHAVVYGHPCIVTAVDQRIVVTVQKTDDNIITVTTPQNTFTFPVGTLLQIPTQDIPKEVRFVVESLKMFSLQHQKISGMNILTKNSFSSTLGFGSSSAVTVALMHALFSLHKLSFTKEQLFALCYEVVIAVQGVGSGFDLAAAIWGGTLFFVTGGKTIQPLRSSQLPLSVAYTGTKADTVTLVQQVAQLRENHPAIVEKLFATIENIVFEAREALESDNRAQLNELVELNQGILESLGVSTPTIRTLRDELKKAGALNAKISGAGGGDCLIVLQDPSKKLEHPSLVEISLQAPGVRLERS